MQQQELQQQRWQQGQGRYREAEVRPSKSYPKVKKKVTLVKF